MDRKSILIGLTVISIFNLSTYMIVRLFLYRNANKCLLLDEAPTPDTDPTLLATMDNFCLVRFSGIVEYPWKDGYSIIYKSKFVKLNAKHVTSTQNNTRLEIEADCGKLTMLWQKSYEEIIGVNFNYLESIDIGNHKQCSLFIPHPPDSSFSVAKGKHYKCDKEHAFECLSDKGSVAQVRITYLEFECNRGKDASATDFSTPARKYLVVLISSSSQNSIDFINVCIEFSC